MFRAARARRALFDARPEESTIQSLLVEAPGDDPYLLADVDLDGAFAAGERFDLERAEDGNTYEWSTTVAIPLAGGPLKNYPLFVQYLRNTKLDEMSPTTASSRRRGLRSRAASSISAAGRRSCSTLRSEVEKDRPHERHARRRHRRRRRDRSRQALARVCAAADRDGDLPSRRPLRLDEKGRRREEPHHDALAPGVGLQADRAARRRRGARFSFHRLRRQEAQLLGIQWQVRAHRLVGDVVPAMPPRAAVSSRTLLALSAARSSLR